MKKKTVVLILISLFLSVWGSGAMAADVSGEQNGAIEIRLKAGSEQVVINGQTLTVEKPYEANGTTLVPLRVITVAFGSKLSWDSKTQTIGLSYAGHGIILKIGSLEATKDEEKVLLNVAPQIKNDTTMVPIRFISENFGGKVHYDPATKEIVITGLLQNTEKAAPSNINPDEGKTQIGNSYFHWSMKYPSGLVTSYQSFNGDYVEFSDAAGEYTMYISVESISEVNISDEGLLQKLSGQLESNDTILDTKIVRTNGVRYAEIVSKNKVGNYYEDRAYVDSGNIYYLTLKVIKSEDFRNTSKYQVYQNLLNSFKTSFNANDSKLKDLSEIKNGYRKYKDDDYGLSLEIPGEWTKVDGNHSMTFKSSDGSHVITLSVSSLADGDSLDAWIKRENNRFTESFVEGSRTISETKSSTLNGIEAKSVKYAFTFGGAWLSDETVYFSKGNYKYSLDFIFPKETGEQANLQAMVKHVKESVTIDESQFNPALGYIQDPDDIYNGNKIVTVNNNKYHFSLQVPEYWTAGSDNSDTLMKYSFTGGSLTASVITTSTMDEYVKTIEDGQNFLKNTIPDFKILENSYTAMLGQKARKYVTEMTISGIPLTDTVYLISKDNILYQFELVIAKAASTEENLARLNGALLSIQFLN